MSQDLSGMGLSNPASRANSQRDLAGSRANSHRGAGDDADADAPSLHEQRPAAHPPATSAACSLAPAAAPSAVLLSSESGSARGVGVGRPAEHEEASMSYDAWLLSNPAAGAMAAAGAIPAGVAPRDVSETTDRACLSSTIYLGDSFTGEQESGAEGGAPGMSDASGDRRRSKSSGARSGGAPKARSCGASAYGRGSHLEIIAEAHEEEGAEDGAEEEGGDGRGVGRDGEGRGGPRLAAGVDGGVASTRGGSFRAGVGECGADAGSLATRLVVGGSRTGLASGAASSSAIVIRGSDEVEDSGITSMWNPFGWLLGGSWDAGASGGGARVDGPHSLASSSSVASAQQQQQAAAARDPPGLRVEKVHKKENKQDNKQERRERHERERAEARAHRREMREKAAAEARERAERAEREAAAMIRSASHRSAASTATAQGSTSRGGSGGGHRPGHPRLRKDKHKLSLFTPRDEELLAYRKATSAAAEAAKKEKAAAALLASKGIAPAPESAGGALAPIGVVDKVSAPEMPRAFRKQALADACSRMQASGQMITMLFSSATAGADEKGSPPTHRSVRDAWDQPVRVSSLELATALGLEKEEYPAEELLEVAKEELAKEAKSEESAAPAPAAADAPATANLSRLGPRERARELQKMMEAKSFRNKAAASAALAGAGQGGPGSQDSQRKMDPVERFKRTHIDYASFLNGSRSPKAQQQQRSLLGQTAPTPYAKPGPADKAASNATPGKQRRKPTGNADEAAPANTVMAMGAVQSADEPSAPSARGAAGKAGGETEGKAKAKTKASAGKGKR